MLDPVMEDQGEVAPAGPEINHGTLLGYYQGCRCEPCREQKMVQRRRPPTRFRAGEITSEQAKYCQICGVRTSEHPMVACWRTLK